MRPALAQQFAPGAVSPFPAHLAFHIGQTLRRAVGLTVEPENLRSINAVNTRQRVVAVLVAVDVGQRHIPVHLLKQPEPFPDKARGDGFAERLTGKVLTAGLADAPPQRVVAEADFHLWLIAIAWLTDDIRQAVLSIVAVAPAGLPVIFLNRAAINVITPANAVQLRQTVVRDLLSRTYER